MLKVGSWKLEVGSWKLEVKRKYKYEIQCHTELVEVKIIAARKQRLAEPVEVKRILRQESNVMLNSFQHRILLWLHLQYFPMRP